MQNSLLFSLVTSIALGLTGNCYAQIADYPTQDRILFADECVRAHPERPRQEMLYKCACLIDAVAEEIPYAEFSELATAANASTIAGERGSAVRSEGVLAQAKHYRQVLARASKSCLIQP